jgi:hypothetical protein
MVTSRSAAGLPSSRNLKRRRLAGDQVVGVGHRDQLQALAGRLETFGGRLVAGDEGLVAVEALDGLQVGGAGRDLLGEVLGVPRKRLTCRLRSSWP